MSNIKVGSHHTFCRISSADVGPSRNTEPVDLSETGLALADVGGRVQDGVRLVGALVAQVSILGAIADALEGHLGETWPADTLVSVPDGVGNDRASVLVDSLARCSSIKGSIGADASSNWIPGLLKGALDTVVSVVDLSSGADTPEVVGVPDEAVGARNVGQTSVAVVAVVSAIGAEVVRAHTHDAVERSSGRALGGKDSTRSSVEVSSIATVSSGLAGGSGPAGSRWARSWVEDALLSVPDVSEGAFVVSLVHAPVNAEERGRRAADDSALVSIPVSSSLALRVSTDTSLKYKSEGTVALVVQGIVDLSVVASWNRLAAGVLGISSSRALAGIDGGVPDAAVGAGNLRRNTGFIDVNPVGWAHAGFGIGIPISTVAAGVEDTEVSIPDGAGRALAAPQILDPDSSTGTLLLDVTLALVLDGSRRARAGQAGLVPDFAVGTRDTSSSVEFETSIAGTFLDGLVPVLVAGTHGDGETSITAPVKVGSTHTLFIGGVPNSVSSTFVSSFAVLAVPFVS